MLTLQRGIVMVLVVTIVAMAGARVFASSHREAPLISEDPTADNTDVYAFISPDNPDNLVVVANYIPLLLPMSGPNFYRFSDNVAYEIHIDNTGDARSDLIYQFRFKTSLRNPDTFLYNTGPVDSINDPDLNVVQTYEVRRLDGQGRLQEVVASDVPVAPWYVGDRTFPGGTYDSIASEAVFSMADGTRLFAGPRDEPFFVDLGVFDLLGVMGTPSTDGLNVMSIVLEVPIEDLTADGTRPPAGSTGLDSILGIHATASRRVVNVLRRQRGATSFGPFRQVSRLGLPLINEVIVPLASKDAFNSSRPQDDATNLQPFLLFPELPGLLEAVLGVDCLDTPSQGRTDLVALLSPNGTTFADLLRININQGQTFADTGFPNGRKLEDDVVDTLLTVVCGSSLPISDSVDTNDRPFSSAFPYLASPHSGNPTGAPPTTGRAVKLDFQTGSFPADSIICLDRIIPLGGCVGVGPECDTDPHLHFTILIDSAGPFDDPRDGDGCGHGKVFSRSGCGPDIVPSCSGG